VWLKQGSDVSQQLITVIAEFATTKNALIDHFEKSNGLRTKYHHDQSSQ